MLIYDARDWYWRAEDGRRYGSAKGGLIADHDPDLLAWGARGGIETPWPRDAAGAQTLAALNLVLAPFGLVTDLAAYAAQVRFAHETAGIEVAGERIRTDRESQTQIAGAHALALVDHNEPIDFKAATGWVSIDSVAMILIAQAVARHVRDCFRRERQVAAAIAAGTITTRAEIDAAFAA